MNRRAFRLAILLAAGGCGSFGAAVTEETPSDDAGSGDAQAGADVQVPDGAASDASDAAEAADDATAAVDASTILDGSPWSSPNDASWTVMADGTRITGFASYNHPVIVWVASAKTSSEDYTVTATIMSPPSTAATREFGLFARAAPGGAGVVLGSEYGGTPKTFLAPMGPPLWSPSSNTFGPVYPSKASTRYKMKLQVAGIAVSGKLWEATAVEPPSFQVMGSAAATGKLAGFYTYTANGAVLESFAITGL